MTSIYFIYTKPSSFINIMSFLTEIERDKKQISIVQYPKYWSDPYRKGGGGGGWGVLGRSRCKSVLILNKG